MLSIQDIFSIGVGPSSSHTVGPMCAARAFIGSVDDHGIDGGIGGIDGGVLCAIRRIRVTLYGSLALTGLGHGTDRAILAGLEGATPADVDTDHMAEIVQSCEHSSSLNLMGTHRIAFDYGEDIVFERWKRMLLHPNGMRFQAFDGAGSVLDEQVWYSIGGGFIRKGTPHDPLVGLHDNATADSTWLAETTTPASDTSQGDIGDVPANEDSDSAPVPYDFATCDELLALCDAKHMSIEAIMMANEKASRPEADIVAGLDSIWHIMHSCVQAGCTSKRETLPGGLHVPRRAAHIYRSLKPADIDILGESNHSFEASLKEKEMEWVDLFALAVSEENASGGRIVTAPTNGSAGIIPAVLHYYWYFVPGANIRGIERFLLTAGAVGYLFKRNASISGAEVGCQGEVGSACSMAAAGLCAVLGGTPAQIENAAEIGIEHHLGLTCDPVAGLVQIPCIERNAMASMTAINAARISLLAEGKHMVSLDQAINTMKQTGHDMMDKYKETSRGGLAVNVVEC
ncbi:L-serine ammonia-lyase [Bifidobacterium aquikefiricola]|uniref:L-serine dehydratase n=1 Tax=Bifidobacterium aquikefiricola TaxID=3059038 RepID=A0AB39U7H5_9BIFI